MMEPQHEIDTKLPVCLLGNVCIIANANAEERECYEVAMTNATGGGSLSSILINKCTGDTWILVRTNIGNATTNRWFPITVEVGEAKMPITPPPAR
jgi:hypothetical protein